MIQGVKHIVFDLGGVLLNIDYFLTEKAFIDLGITNFAELFSQKQQSLFFDKWEMGQISRQEFIATMQMADNKISLTEEQIVMAWNAMLLDFPLRRLQILQQLQLHYDLVLLSNTNEIHEEAFNKILMSTCGMPSLGVFFDKVYYSHKIGMRKPMKELFTRVLMENNFEAHETLFIDDSPQHIEAAKGRGYQTIWLEKGMTIENDIFKPKG